MSQTINKLFLINKLKLPESLDKTVKSSKYMLQSQVRKLFETACRLTFMCCFTVINSVAAITLKTINNTRAEFFWETHL